MSGVKAMALLKASESTPLSGGPSFTLMSRAHRALWNASWLLLARWTPPFAHPWRRFLLRLFGARIGEGAHIYSSAKIWLPRNLTMDAFACLGPAANCYCIAEVRLGAHVVISQGAELCTGSHDLSDPAFQLVAKPIVVEQGAWIAAGAFVGPGVTIGERAVLGARAVAFKDIPAGSIFIGNPAAFLKAR